jgi:hypothetical protein
MNNSIINNVDFLNGLNINPIPLEFSQTLTTTKWLLTMQAKLSEIMVNVNGWYDTLVQDLEKDGVLYAELINHIDSAFTEQLTGIHTSIADINLLITDMQADIILALYVAPSATLTIAPTQLLYKVGETINSAVLHFNVVKGSDNIVKAEIYKNGVLLSTVNTITNGDNTFTDGSIISSDALYYIKLFDDKNNVLTNTIGYNFVNNIYVGVVADNIIITNTIVSGLPTIKSLKGEFTYSFSPNGQKITIAYPAIYGNLVSISGDNEELIESFVISSVTISSVNYTVYTSIDTLFDTTHDLKFNF